MNIHFIKADGKEPADEPLHYTACGLDDVYLVNGFTREFIDGEEFITIEDLDNLWKAIGLHLITKRKVLAPKEVRFLREHMRFTQAELGAKMRVSDQTVARWEKGNTTPIPGPADLMIRVLFLASDRAQPEGAKILDDIMPLVDEIIKRDDYEPRPVTFILSRRKWSETPPKRVACR